MRSLRHLSSSTAILAVAATAVLLPPASPVTASPVTASAAAAPTDSPDATTEPVGGLTLTNSFVSPVGWVKPGDSYPSRLLLRNTTNAIVPDATVVVKAPRVAAFTGASSTVGTVADSSDQVTWTVPSVAAGSTVQLVLTHEAATLEAVPTLVWRDLSTTATLTVGDTSAAVASHGPKVIPPGGAYDSARYGDRPFPVVPVSYTDRDYQATHSGDDLEAVINDPELEGSTFNLYQEMSLGQLYPQGTVPSAGVDRAGFDYEPGFDFTRTDPETASTCGGTTFADSPGDVQGTALYPDRIVDGVYQLPGSTGWYGSDGGGSALVGALTGVGALMQVDSGCGPTAKLVRDAAAIADPEIDYSDYDTDKDGVVDFFMAVFAGCGGNGASQLSVAGCAYPGAPYDNVWPHSSSLEYSYSDPESGLPGFTTDDQLKDLEGHKLYYTSAARSEMTTTATEWPVYVRVGPYNVNPEDAIDHASVISHEYGHSLGLPDFYSLGSRGTYGTWNLMAADHSQNMDVFSRQELGWIVPDVLEPGTSPAVSGWKDSKEDTDVIHWQAPDGTPYTLTEGADGRVQNAQSYVAKLPGRVLLDPAAFTTGEGASPTHAWWSNSGNDFGCATNGKGHNLDLMIPGIDDLPAGSTVELSMKSMFDIEWDFDYGFVLTSTDGGQDWASSASTRSVPTTTATSNPNQNGCQTAFGNGITGSSASYTDTMTVTADRTLGNYPSANFITDTFDISELAGADLPVLRFSYSTDPGLARPGWFIDDVSVTATLPDGSTQDLLVTDLESDGGPDDPRVFNGGCKGDGPGAACTPGWTYVNAGAEAEYDHAYYLEMRDRSGFDLDGNDQSDRGPVDWAAGLSVVYTDEAHGYGNVGTDDPPAQTPLDSQPEPGSAEPDLSDAAWTGASGDNAFSDDGSHVENYTDPSNEAAGNPWVFDFGCLAFEVTSMAGNTDGPEAGNGDLTGDVAFDLGAGCSAFDYAYGDPAPPAPRAPTAVAQVSPKLPVAGERFKLLGDQSSDPESPADDLTYAWDFHDGGTTVDSTSRNPTVRYPQAGVYDVTLTVTDDGGLSDEVTIPVTVRRPVDCQDAQVARNGSWRERSAAPAWNQDYCDNLGTGSGRDAMRVAFPGDVIDIGYAARNGGGFAIVKVDGERVGKVSFAGTSQRLTFRHVKSFAGLGEGDHVLWLVVRSGPAYLDRFVVMP